MKQRFALKWEGVGISANVTAAGQAHAVSAPSLWPEQACGRGSADIGLAERWWSGGAAKSRQTRRSGWALGDLLEGAHARVEAPHHALQHRKHSHLARTHSARMRHEGLQVLVMTTG